MAIPKYMSNNYETLLKAADARHVALMECRRVDNGEVVYALCAVGDERVVAAPPTGAN